MILLWSALVVPAVAERPTAGGLFAYDSADVVTSWDAPGGRIRVHYAIEGPSVARLEDEDGDGVPDYVALVAEHVDGAWDTFEETGFRTPLRESDLGLGAPGGSGAFDVYLLDFGGSADGAFRVDGCKDGVCAGYLTIENDFVGYGYPTLEDAAKTLASHELFHAVQASYTDSLDVWVSEGTATWAERHYDPDNRDYLRFAEAYLADTGRSLDKPPVGPVPTFAYATALWFDFLTLRHDDELMVDLMEALSEAPTTPLDQIGGLVMERSDDWPAAFTDFTQWNMATAARAGGLSAGGYPYADRLVPGVRFEGFAEVYDDDPRVFPLAAIYIALDHPGGALWVGSAECDADRPQITVHPALDGPVLDAIDTISGQGREVAGGDSLASGRYYLVLSQPQPGGDSVKTRICAGSPEALASDCFDPCAEATDDTDLPAPPEEGCEGCASRAGSPFIAGWLGLVVVWIRRRRDVGSRLH